MRRKIEHSKRYKEYPSNVPRKLLQIFFALDRKVSWLANDRRVNSGVISALLNDGKEPKDLETRARLFLKPVSICPKCGRRIIKARSTNKPASKQEPYIKAWRRLPQEIRNNAIKQFILYRTKQKELEGK